MKTVKTLAELHRAGAKVEGMRFIEVKDRTSPAELATVLAEIEKTSTTLQGAIFASVKAIVEGLGGQEVHVMMPEHKEVKHWVFEIERDREGYLKKIHARADTGH
mgnify:FL=1